MADPNSGRVTQLPEKEIVSSAYQQRVLQLIINNHRILIKALKVDMGVAFEQLLSDEDKVLLDKLLVAGTIDSTVPQVLEDVIDLQSRVTALEVFHP